MIRGNKKGGGSGRAPVEAKDTLRSIAYARVMDLVCEGEIEGLVNGAQSIYLDGTPLESSTGVRNFSGASFETRNGTQGQAYIKGFPAVESENSVNVQVAQATPIVRTISNANVNAVRVTIGIPSLQDQNVENGDLNGSSVELKIEVQSNGGGYVVQSIGSRYVTTGTSVSGLVVTSAATSTGVRFSAKVVSGTGVAKVQYRVYGTTTWIDYDTLTFTDNLRTVEVSGLAIAKYEVRLLPVSGSTPVIVVVTLGTFGGNYGSLVPSGNDIIKGKASSRYQRSYRIPLTGSPPWDIRVTRITADSGRQTLQNDTWWDSYTEIIDAKLRYPNSALVAMSIDSSQFQNIPVRGYDMKLLRVKIPSNYNPITRAYTGTWDGTFTTAWTDNPAWCFYDLVTNSRYGLGDFIPAAQIDKWALYTIAQYCDGLVSDGFGGTEPRFTCNLYLQTRADAYKVLNDMASIFRGMLYWSAGAITAVQDSPASAAYLYSPANVVDGLFTYSGSSRRTRHTTALVTWADPADLYRAKIEYVEDTAGVALYGVMQTEVSAVGCTSRGQAHRVGRWLLYSERLETEVVSFKTGLDGAIARPGQIIKIADPARAGVRFGGRLLAATTTTATLDATVTLVAGQTYTLSVLKSDGTVMNATVSTGAGSVSALTFSALAEAPAVGSIWILASTAVAAQTFRVISVSEGEDGVYEINALESDQSKFSAVESNLTIESRSISVLSSRPAAPTGGLIEETLYEAPTDLKVQVTISWAAVAGASSYLVSYRRDDGNFIELPANRLTSIQIQDALPGEYAVTVVAANTLGYKSSAYTFYGTVYGKTAAPADITGLRLAVQGGSGLISWDLVPDLDVKIGGQVEIRFTTDTTAAASWSTSVPSAAFSGATTSGTVPLLPGTYFAKARDSSGLESVTAAAVSTTAPSVIGYNVVVVSQQDSTFAGTKTNLEVASGRLQLGALFYWDDIPDFDALTNPIDAGIQESGEYIFDAPIDIGSVYSCRVSPNMIVQTYDVTNFVDTWASVDAVTDIDGVIGSDAASVAIYISTTRDNPTGSPTWSAWAPLVVSDYEARGFRFKVSLARSADLLSQQVAISTLRVTVDVPDRIEAAKAVAVPAGGLAVTYARSFYDVPAVAVTASNLATGDYAVISAKTAAGFTLQFLNSAGTGVARTADWIAKGYGYGST